MEEGAVAGASGARGSGGGGGGRKEEQEQQLGAVSAEAAWSGVVVFDECHRSKGLKPGDDEWVGSSASTAVAGAGGGGRAGGILDDDLLRAGGGGGGGRGRRRGRGGGGAGTSSKASLAVVELQARLPSARVLYTSATGVSSLEDCGYLVS